ncbi:MAG: hypothetical protein ACYTEO_15120 [Planctomycetota bacterium]|jgi:hypothetical protein
MSSNVNIGINIKAYDEASKTLTVTGKGVETLCQKTKVAGNEVAKTGKKFSAFSDTLKVTAGIVLRDLVKKISTVVSESFKLGAQIGTLQASFDRLTKEAGATDISLEKLRQATKSTVSDVDLLTAANNALALGLPVDDLDDLFASAMDVGHAMGRTTLQAVQDLTTGIGRGSARILDNLGILIDTNQSYEDFAVTLGKTASELTEAEKKTAFQTAAFAALNEKARVLEGTTSDAQLQQEKWNASITNAKTATGEFLGPLGALAPALQTLTPLISTMTLKVLPSLITKEHLATLAKHGLTVATKLFNLILKANPILLIVSAIALIIAAFTDWGGVIKWVQDRIEGLFGWLRDVADFFGGLFGGITKALTGGATAQAKAESNRMFIQEEDEAPSVVPVLTAQKGIETLIKKPTLILAGERGTERLSITPGTSTEPVYRHRGVQRVQLIFNAPIVNVEGSADPAVAEDTAVYVEQVLQNVVVEATSPEAPTEQKRIRVGTSLISPTTIKPSTRTGRTGGRTTFPI